MRGVYRETRAGIATAIETIMNTANVEVEDATAVERAVRWFRQGLDFADAVHLASSGHADQFVTFDTAMRRRAKALGIEPETVAP
jgi:predicted nucleic-acid-binding protein